MTPLKGGNMKLLAVLGIIFSLSSFTAEASVDPSAVKEKISTLLTAAKPGGLEMAKLALDKAKSPLVKKYAQKLVSDYLVNSSGVSSIAGKLGVGSDSVSSLSKLSGNAFDKTFMQEQVSAQEDVVDTLKDKLIPNAQDNETKSLLTQAKDKVMATLAEGKKIQSQL
jgi:putative membrane protein